MEEEIDQPEDYKALLDRMEVLIDKLYNKRKVYPRKRRKRYYKLLHKQLKFLRAQLE
ncbi:MAG: hypothetical protein AAF518_27130 [Spirochaetota bacterium]